MNISIRGYKDGKSQCSNFRSFDGGHGVYSHAANIFGAKNQPTETGAVIGSGAGAAVVQFDVVGSPLLQLDSGSASPLAGTALSEGYDTANPSSFSAEHRIVADAVTPMGISAFYSGTIKKVDISASVTNINSVFYGNSDYMTALTEYNVAADNMVYESTDGALFTKGQTELIRCPQGKAGASYTVPTTVTKFWDGLPNLSFMFIHLCHSLSIRFIYSSSVIEVRKSDILINPFSRRRCPLFSSYTLSVLF